MRLAAVAALLVALMLAPAAGAAVPRGFVGMNVDGPVLDGTVPLAPAMNRMVSTGVQSIRVVFNWAAAQPLPNGPIGFTATDQVVALAAARHLTVLPVVIYAPTWDSASHPAGDLAPPLDDGPYADYLTALVQRYGPRGSFWTANPQLPKDPIRMWQIWNEPNFTYYWSQTPFASSYVALVQAAHAAVKAADPGAKVVLAGFPDTAWDYLKQIYAVPGARSAFDVVAAHPYTMKPANVIRFLALMRHVMGAHGDRRKPLLVTETGWNSSHGHASDPDCCQTSRKGQARDIAKLLPLLASHRRALHLLGFYYYTWAAHEYRHAPSFNFAGLFDQVGAKLIAKPSYFAFKARALALEGCRRKRRVATSCLG
jgi:polysaccharide biosynthesis protein PslG